MARPTVLEIKQQILSKKTEYESLNGMDSTSNVAIYNLWAYIVAFVMWTLYQFFELFKSETDEKIRSQKAFKELWYQAKALEYRHGHPLEKVLVPGSEESFNLEYLDDNYTQEEIANALVVKRAAVIELEITNQIILFVKCAAEEGGQLSKLTDGQIQGLVDYFRRIKPAGTKLQVFSDKADDLRLTIDFFYDPLILTENGTRIDGANNTPVQDAVREYLENLRFNGEFSLAELEDILQGLSGCANREAYITAAERNFQTPENWETINNLVVANSGYMDITDENFSINFIPKTVLD